MWFRKTSPKRPPSKISHRDLKAHLTNAGGPPLNVAPTPAPLLSSEEEARVAFILAISKAPLDPKDFSRLVHEAFEAYLPHTTSSFRSSLARALAPPGGATPAPPVQQQAPRPRTPTPSHEEFFKAYGKTTKPLRAGPRRKP